MTTHHRFLLAAAVLLSAATQLFAAPPPSKQPWELTPEEHAAQRVAQNKFTPQNTMFTSDKDTPVVLVNGQRNPAAFMPYEVFRDLVQMGFESLPATKQLFRQRVTVAAVAMGFGSDFWPSLQTITAPLVQSELRSQALAKAGRVDAARRESDRQCALRAAAQSAANQRFGTAKFQQLLYQAVAPDMGMTDDARDAQQLLFVEGGCQ